MLDSQGNVKDRFFWGAKQDELLCENNNWTLCDHLGTVRKIVDPLGNSVSHLEYNAFGKLLNVSGMKPLFRYTGKLFDDVTGLQWNINRWYDQKVGRWCSEDPIGFGGKDTNLERYVVNSIITILDPDGLAHHAITMWVDKDNIFDNIGNWSAIIGEMDRIYSDCINDHACPGHDIKVYVFGTQKTKQELSDLGLIGKMTNSTITNKSWGYYVHNFNGPQGYGQGANFVVAIHIQRIRDAAADNGGLDEQKSFATVFVHEIQEATFTSIHVGVNEYVDSPTGKVGGKLSPKGCKRLLKYLGIPVK